jgi:ketosteroid isomerase-like protein
MKKVFFVLIALMFVSTSFAQDQEKIKAKIEEMNKAIVKCMLDNDMNTMLKMYTDDIISMPSYQPTIQGIAKVKELSEMQAKSGWKTNHFEIKPTDFLFAGNLVVEIGTYDMNMSGPGVPEWPDNGKYMTIWEQQPDGSLKIKVETWNTNTNPWAQMKQQKQEEMKKTE